MIKDIDLDFDPPLRGAALAMAEAQAVLAAFHIPLRANRAGVFEEANSHEIDDGHQRGRGERRVCWACTNAQLAFRSPVTYRNGV